MTTLLWTCILRAKYLRNRSFWSISKPQKCSTTWAAILESRSLLKKGCMWLIGNGESITIRDEPWIPSIHDHTIPGITENSDHLIKGQQLINPETKEWNTNIIENAFDQFTATQIKKIYINKEAKDRLIWKLTPHGNFTPQSFQKLLMERAGESSDTGQNTFPWKKFWAVGSTAPKIKLFVWRAIHRGPGVLQRIEKFVEGVDPICRHCNNHEEDADHLLIHCNLAQMDWFASPIGLRLKENQDITFSQWLTSQDSEYTFAMGASVQEILRIAGYWSNLYFGVDETMETEGTSQPHETGNNSAHVWISPPTNFFKINVDAAVKNGHYASAAIVRNHEGKCCGISTRLGVSNTPVVAEADGFCLAVELAILLGLESVIIEGVTIRPGHPFTHRYDRTKGKLHISQATIHESGRSCKTTELVKVICNVGHSKDPIYLCSLSANKKHKSFPLNYEFGEDDGEAVLSVHGLYAVHLAGYFLGDAGGRAEGL
ncbi:uncharacterized protein LOC113272281 [Papaver somniferum]|uniref:uncharacterized protein LOC113272281 n=1 Tax=Papaver somniferum TaxID=3469 RepID=UPI000E6FE13D|nr:uncharacterized protein LOC113272281 [Papaver somniferum]